jgi:hypothetical protein
MAWPDITWHGLISHGMARYYMAWQKTGKQAESHAALGEQAD